jgi:imidazole glycerol-phosphate synthase subunit HisH
MIALVNIKFSNLKAYKNLLEYLEQPYELVSRASDFTKNHNTIIIPGVSNFGSIALNLKENNLDEIIKKAFFNEIKIIGTCAGMQIFFEKSKESTGSVGLSLIKGHVKKFNNVDGMTLNIGWKSTNHGKFYFVHNFYCKADQTLDDCSYCYHNGVKFLSEFRHKNLYGLQYHPEKSGQTGIQKFKSILDA